jgi:hypothetical protein
MSEKRPAKEFNFREANRNVKRSSEQQGRVIRIGGVTFRSNFECGNLSSVQMTTHNTYKLELERETNSNRTSAWFYFSVEGVRGEAHFVIEGFTKSSSLYSEGMKVCYRDTREMSKWRRGGTRISYTRTEEGGEEESGNSKPQY